MFRRSLQLVVLVLLVGMAVGIVRSWTAEDERETYGSARLAAESARHAVQIGHHVPAGSGASAGQAAAGTSETLAGSSGVRLDGRVVPVDSTAAGFGDDVAHAAQAVHPGPVHTGSSGARIILDGEAIAMTDASGFADDAARGFGSAADDLGRGAAGFADDAARGIGHGVVSLGDDAARGAGHLFKLLLGGGAVAAGGAAAVLRKK